MKLGLLLPNQGVVFGATTVPELLELAEQAEGSGIFESLWVGDNLLAKPRLESVTLLSALAVRTKTCRLGTACMASFPLRHPVVLAAQWSALDCLADGRTVLTACIGGGPAKGNIKELPLTPFCYRIAPLTKNFAQSHTRPARNRRLKGHDAVLKLCQPAYQCD